MKTSGIVRKVDELGRIVLPVEMRRLLNISEKDAMEISLENEAIVIRKHHSECIFCGSVRDVISFKGRNVCALCIDSLKNK
ncbi:MAG: AbrB/MazE/SpoVT family DNA-binding domain-containing protein [Oscillospiraceae bacterium]|nr:AbrB/MazE/SpoVT family DNA-binding domain-containing protein [Oscillospiraceae bacterium]